MKGQHPRVTVWKVRNTLKAAGLSDEASQQILSHLQNEARGVGTIRLKRTVQKKIVQALAQDGKCGLVLTRTNKVMVMSGDHVKFPHWEQGERNIHPVVSKPLSTRNKTTKPRLSQSEKETLRADIRAGILSLRQIAEKFGVNYSTAHYYRQMLNGAGTLEAVAAGHSA